MAVSLSSTVVSESLLQMDAGGNEIPPSPRGQKRTAAGAVEPPSTSAAEATSDGGPALVLHAVVHQADADTIDAGKMLCLRHAGLHAKNPHLGLRATPEGACVRAEGLFLATDVATTGYRLLVASLSPQAVARLTATSAGAQNWFAPMLTKRTYAAQRDGSDADWGAWHHHGDLSLKGDGVSYEIQQVCVV